MPKWGLTVEQRKSKPWGLSPELLEPAKTITDPVHSDIYLTNLEISFLDSPPMQRLRRIRQLGTTHLVYPGATHSRFSHSLGTLRSSQDLLDAVLAQRYGPHPVIDLFKEWEASPPEYDKKVAEATVLARLGGLLHDMCHIAFGHTLEDDLQILTPHDSNSWRYEQLWALFPENIQSLPSELRWALRHLILSSEKNTSPNAQQVEAINRYPFVYDIVGNTICADLIDYLERDHLYMGLPAKLGHRFIDGFYVTRADTLFYPKHMAIKITRNGRLRADVITELFKFLRYRYELTERGLVHHAKISADAMIGKMLEMWNDAVCVEKAIEHNPNIDIGQLNNIDFVFTQLEKLNNTLPALIRNEAKEELEKRFLNKGDDGLLEWVVEWAEPGIQTDSRKKGIYYLGHSLLERQLYKLAAKSNQSTLARSSEIWEKYGKKEIRRKLEQDVALYANLDYRWHVILWIPAPTMRLKAADVLVDADDQVLRLKDYDRTMKHGKDIYDSHEALWAVSVYLHPAVANDQIKKQVILTWLGEKLGLDWEEKNHKQTLVELASEKIALEKKLTRIQERQLVVSAAHYKGENTFSTLCANLEKVVQSWSIDKTAESTMKEQGEPKKLL